MNYEYRKSKNDDQWYWHLKASNGETIAQGEAYTTKPARIAAIKLVKNSGAAPETKRRPMEIEGDARAGGQPG